MIDKLEQEISEHGALLQDTVSAFNAVDFSNLVGNDIHLWGSPTSHVAVAFKGMTYLWRIVDGKYDGSSVYVKDTEVKSPWVLEEGKGWVRVR